MVGRNVSMCVCGPTVYDVAHMGHARAYLTFDIMRRILEDYFNYNVLFQVNVTDIDDKIILKARKGALLKDYRAKNLSIDAAKSDAAKALQKRKVVPECVWEGPAPAPTPANGLQAANRCALPACAASRTGPTL